MASITHCSMEPSMTAATAFRPDADTAVLLIDVQESFRHRPYWDPAGFEPYMARPNALLTRAPPDRLPALLPPPPRRGPGRFRALQGPPQRAATRRRRPRPADRAHPPH